jgi:hypothetical protein
MAGSNSTARVREALTGTTTVKEKGPPVADGILSVTPDTPEVAEWRNKQSLDCVATTSSYLEDDDGEEIVAPPLRECPSPGLMQRIPLQSRSRTSYSASSPGKSRTFRR